MGFPISWATPEANLPIEANFSDLTISSWACLSSRLVRSRDCMLSRNSALLSSRPLKVILSARESLPNSLIFVSEERRKVSPSLNSSALLTRRLIGRIMLRYRR